MSTDDPKGALLAQFATLAKALGHANRLELIEFIAQGERSVESLARRCGLSIGNTSQHLHQLRRAGLVTSRREGKHVLYRLADEAVVGLLVTLRQIAERNIAAVQQIVNGYFHERDALEPVSRAQLVARMNEGKVILLDVRPEDEFVAGHLSNAINIPLHALESHLAELPDDQEIVAYCRGAYCVLSFEAVAALRNRGFNARRLEDGFPEWKAAGLPVEQAPVAAIQSR